MSPVAHTDPEVMRYVGSPPGPKSLAETAERVRQRIHEDHGPLGAGAFHGLCALVHMPAGDDIELAYRLVRHSWGHGIATEAAGALLGYAFDTLTLPKVVAVTYHENRARFGLLDYKGIKAAHYVVTREAWGP